MLIAAWCAYAGARFWGLRLEGICKESFDPTADVKIGLPPGPKREAEEPRIVKARSRRVVYDKRTIPDDCPLRQDDWTITIAGGN